MQLLILPVFLALSAFGSVHASPLVHQIYYDAPGADAHAVFTELSGPAFFDLHGWSLQAINGSNHSPYRTISLSGNRIGADGFFLLATSTALPSLAGQRDLVAEVDWQNGPDALYLLDPSGAIADAVSYGATTLPSGFMNPAPDVGAGQSLIRRITGWHTGDNAADFVVDRFPRPTQAPTAAVPEPTSLVLLSIGWGILLFGRLSRRF